MIVCLINGSTTVRSRETEGTNILECGCAYSDWPYMWTQMCKPHCIESDTLHAKARADHDRAEAVKELTS